MRHDPLKLFNVSKIKIYILLFSIPDIAPGPGVQNLNIVADYVSLHGHFGGCFFKPNFPDPPHDIVSRQSSLGQLHVGIGNVWKLQSNNEVSIAI